MKMGRVAVQHKTTETVDGTKKVKGDVGLYGAEAVDERRCSVKDESRDDVELV